MALQGQRALSNCNACRLEKQSGDVVWYVFHDHSAISPWPLVNLTMMCIKLCWENYVVQEHSSAKHADITPTPKTLLSTDINPEIVK